MVSYLSVSSGGTLHDPGDTHARRRVVLFWGWVRSSEWGFTLPHPSTKPNNARILHLCAAIQFIHCCRSVMEGEVSGNCWTLDTYILYQIPRIQSAVFTAHFNLNSTPSTIKKVCKAKPCWSITLFWVPFYLFLGCIWWKIWITNTDNRRSLFIVIVMQWLSWLFH